MIYRSLILQAVLLATVIGTSSVLAQDTDTLRLSRPVFEFVRSGHLGVAPDGRLYVPDLDAHVVHAFDPDGSHSNRWGGPGLDEGQFDEPTDVDPGLGLVINVADARNGRIQRFTKDFRLIEVLPVPGEPDEAGSDANPSFRAGDARLAPPSTGIPIALTSSLNDDLYVVNARSNLVVRWDRERRNSWWIGIPGQGPGYLQQPVDIAAGDRLLFVGDAGCACIIVYDHFGTFVRTLSEGLLSEIKSVSITQDGLIAILPFQIIEYDSSGVRIRSVYVETEIPLRDAGVYEGQVIILTENGLHIESWSTSKSK